MENVIKAHYFSSGRGDKEPPLSEQQTRAMKKMELSEFEIKKIEKAVAQFMEKRRPAPHIRAQLDLDVRIRDQSVELFEIRPRWDNPAEKIEAAIAKATYVKVKKIWKIFWQRQDLKWHGYQPKPQVKTIEEFFAVVDQDAHGCFFG